MTCSSSDDKRKYVSIAEALKSEGKKVAIRGWVWRERGSNAVRFVILRDSSDVIQCVLDNKHKDWELAQKVRSESAVKVTGKVVKNEKATTGYEIQVEDFEAVDIGEVFPMGKDQNPEFLADNRHLWIRSRRMTAIMKIRSAVFGAIHDYFRSSGFYEHQSPIFQSTQCEGGSTLFSVDYFGKPLFLTQSWQLYAEAMIYALEKIYTIAPSFRAEKSKTSRHLTEYWHAEMEIAWASYDDVIDVGEGLIKHVFKTIMEKHKPELEILKRDIKKLEPVIKKPFKRITYTEALDILKKKCKMNVEWGKDLRTIEEDELSKLYDVPIIVTHYPKEVKAFYMKECPNDSKVVHGTDFIATECFGEIIGGSERESDIEKIKKRLKEEGEKLDDYEFYLDLRRFGSVPHGGFGLGVERLIAWICGLDSIKDAIAFPRTMLRYTP